jgi:hypothetical protein
MNTDITDKHGLELIKNNTNYPPFLRVEAFAFQFGFFGNSGDFWQSPVTFLTARAPAGAQNSLYGPQGNLRK